MSKVQVMDHPLIQHKISYIRDEKVGSKEFREIVGEIASLMCYEATRDLKLVDIEIQTPICKTTVKELKGKNDWERKMLYMHRKTLVVCAECNAKIQRCVK